MKAVFVADEVDRDIGVLGDHLRASGATVAYLDRGRLVVDHVEADVVVLLGSNRSAHDAAQAKIVSTEVDLVQRALMAETPVIGICYGAHVLARALGGSSRHGQLPERGWTEVVSSDERLCPTGRWAQMHHDVIVPAATSTVIGWSPAGPQAFIDQSLGAPAIGWQFHPELTVSTLERWLREGYSGSEGVDIGATLNAATRYARESLPVAHSLFHETFVYLGLTDSGHEVEPGRLFKQTFPTT